MILIKPFTTALIGAFLLVGSSYAATKWDMPTPYGDGVHHTKNVRQFADDVTKQTNGELKIVVHSGASLIKHPEIYRVFTLLTQGTDNIHIERIIGEMLFDPFEFDAAMQRDLSDRGLDLLDDFKYNNSFWVHEIKVFVGRPSDI